MRPKIEASSTLTFDYQFIASPAYNADRVADLGVLRPRACGVLSMHHPVMEVAEPARGLRYQTGMLRPYTSAARRNQALTLRARAAPFQFHSESVA